MAQEPNYLHRLTTLYSVSVSDELGLNQVALSGCIVEVCDLRVLFLWQGILELFRLRHERPLLHRNCALKCVILPCLTCRSSLLILQVLADVIGSESVMELILPVVIRLATDGVANVRFNVAKTLQKVAPLLDAQ